jgi:branched-chain amino acid aminotransferase
MSKIWGCRYNNNQVEKWMLPDTGDMDEITREFGEGVYTTLRTYRGEKVLLLSEHLRRLENSAKLSGIPITVNEAGVRRTIRGLIEESGGRDIRIRLIIPFSKPEEMIGLATILVPPSMEDYRQGVVVQTRHMHRDNPEAKVTQFIQMSSGLRKQVSREVHEIIMVDDEGNFLEGLSSNFFVISHGEIWTAEKGVLPGITREIVLQCIRELQIQLRLEGFPLERLDEIEEAFITSATRGILPVRKIDQYNVPNTPGPVTTTLSTRFQQKISELLEEI